MGTTTGGIPFPEPTTRVADTAQVTKDMAEAIDRALDLQGQIQNVWQPEDGTAPGEVLSWDGSDWVATAVTHHGEHVPVAGAGDTSKVLTVDAAGDAVWAGLPNMPDLTDLATKSYADNAAATAVAGVVMPDLSDLASKSYADNAAATAAAGVVMPDLSDLASKSYADNAAATAAAGVVNSAPATLDTLNELSTALGNDPNFATTIATQLGEKVDLDLLTQMMNITENIHGIADTALLETIDGAQAKADAAAASIAGHVHPTDGLVLKTEVNANNGVAGLDGSAKIAIAQLPNISTNVQTGSYTLVLDDAGKMVEMTSGSAQTLTVPPDASVAFPVGTKIDVIRIGAGETTIAADAGVTLNSEGDKVLINAQWQAVTLVKRATDTWVLIGALA